MVRQGAVELMAQVLAVRCAEATGMVPVSGQLHLEAGDLLLLAPALVALLHAASEIAVDTASVIVELQWPPIH